MSTFCSLQKWWYNFRVIIDFHTHIFPPKVRDNRSEYLKQDPSFSTLYSNPQARLASAEDLIASMNQAGIDISIVLNIGWADHELCVETNNYILEAISHYPDRLVGFCAIQPRAGEAAIAEIERCARGGVRGIGELRSDTQGYDLGDEITMRPTAEMARRHRLVILTHSSEPVGHFYAGKGTITPDILYRFISNFTDLDIVCSHWGGGLPFYLFMPEVSQALGHVFFDTAASPFLYRNEVFAWVAQIAGADRILLGTDYPLVAQSKLIGSIQSLSLPEETKKAILGGNARKLLGL